MRFLLVVNDSPWGADTSTVALRFARAVTTAGHRLEAVFFQGDGVYHAVAGQLSDDGGVGPQAAWREEATGRGFDLVLCPAAAARRLPADLLSGLSAPFRQEGLARILERAGGCDRLVTF